jgi:hypothetical protein
VVSSAVEPINAAIFGNVIETCGIDVVAVVVVAEGKVGVETSTTELGVNVGLVLNGNVDEMEIFSGVEVGVV